MSPPNLEARMEGLVERMDALLVRLEAAVDSLSRGPGEGNASGAPVEEAKLIDAFIEKERARLFEPPPLAD